MVSSRIALLGLVLVSLSTLLVPATELSAQGQTTVYPWDGSYGFSDGSLIAGGRWRCLWLGYGTGGVSAGELLLQPKASTAAETHSALVASQFALASAWDITVSATTDKQLRTRKVRGRFVPAPNPWEVAWLIADMASDGSAGLYFIFKPNGVELGAYRGFGLEQIFLDTSPSPAMKIGKTYTYRLVKNGGLVTALIDGKPVAAAPLDRLSSWPLGDRVGLYTEDAAVRFGPVTITVPAP